MIRFIRAPFIRPAPHRIAAFAVTLFGLAGPVAAECAGQNLFGELPPTAQAEVVERAAAVPYATGNFWHASKGDERMTVIGTYHFDDPRHEAAEQAAAGLIAEAGLLLVEAGPEEEQALLSAMGRDPSLMFITEGPSLIQRLPEDTWRKLSEALEARGIPGFMAAKFQPWYATVVLAIPPCAMQQMSDPGGLDGALIDLATELGTPIAALEPYDTVFTLFSGLTEQQEIDMIDSSLVMEGRSADFSATLADMYFAGESRMIWELTRIWSYDMPGYTRARVDAEMAVMEEALMTKRNQAWIPVIEAAAAKTDAPLVAAFGALHLSGETGVLNLLEAEGWELERIEF